jgi:hypothetical protein
VGIVFVVVALGLTLAGCQRAPALAPAAASVEIVGSLTARLKAEGDALMQQQQYEQAAVKYQAALNEAPSDIPIRFGLAVALSHLPRRDETIEQFRIVADRGAPGSAEVRTAREWLVNANVPVSIPSAETAAATSPQGSATAPDPQKGKVLGKIVWRDIEPRSKMVRLNISLIGDEALNRDIRLGRGDFKIGRVYEIRDVPPGAYRLVAEAGGTPMWDLKVVVPAEKETTLDLTDSNAAVPQDFTPPTD